MMTHIERDFIAVFVLMASAGRRWLIDIVKVQMFFTAGRERVRYGFAIAVDWLGIYVILALSETFGWWHPGVDVHIIDDAHLGCGTYDTQWGYVMMMMVRPAAVQHPRVDENRVGS